MPAEQLQRFLQDLRQAERIYDNLEVVIEKTYEHHRPSGPEKPAPAKGLVTRIQESAHYIREEGMVYFRRESRMRVWGESVEKVLTYEGCFDGRESTVTSTGHGVSTIRQGAEWLPAVQTYRPHLFPFTISRDGIDASLSQVLDGSRPHAISEREIVVTSVAFPRESLIRVRLVFVGPREPKEAFPICWEIDFAENENLLPVRAAVFTLGMELRLIDEIVIRNRQDASGQYVPLEAIHRGWSSGAAGDLNRPQRTTIWKFTSVNLSPSYDLKKFRAIPLPDEAQVYRFEGGKLVETLKRSPDRSPK